MRGIGFVRAFGGGLLALGILGLVLGAVPIAANAADQVVIECGPASGVQERIIRAFYVPAFDADHIQRVTLLMTAPVDGAYTFTLTAREGTFDGALVGIATTSLTLVSGVSQEASFDFQSAPTHRGAVVTFQIAKTSGPDNDVYFDPGPCDLYDANCTLCGGQIIETGDATPPLSSFRRNSVHAKIYAPPCTVTCETDAPQRGATGALLTFRATASAQDCTGGWSFHWNFGDGSPIGYGSPVDYTYTAPGVYTWTVTASLGGASCSKTGTIRVGATRFASVLGSGSACTQEAPCTLDTALAGAAQGDTVVLAGGTYTSSGTEVAKVEKSLALLGGWDGVPAGPPNIDCENLPAILDGENHRRGILVAPSTYPFLECLTVTRGKGADDGGGIRAAGAGLSLQDVRITDCLVDSGGPLNPRGGGLFIGGGDLYAQNCLFKKNGVRCDGCSNSLGGGLFAENSSTIEIRGCTFEQNGAWNGGGAYLDGTAGVISDTSFTLNGYDAPAAAYGSGLYVSGGSCSLLRDTFDSNRSGDRGVIILDGTDAVISESSFTRNTAWTDPGVYCDLGTLRMVNCIIADNATTSSSPQSALSLGGTSVLIHNTIARNVGPGGGTGVTLNTDAPYTFQDNIIVGHTTGVFNHSSSGVTLDRTLWGAGTWANGTDLAGPGTATRTGDIIGDPLFVDPTATNYHLAVGSAAQDAGNNAGVFQDIEGNARPQGANFDIGADEIQVGVPLLAYLNMDHNTGTAPLEVAFTGGYAGGAPMYTFEWDFGDGSPHSAQQSPHHNYGVPGTYSVTFTVRDGFGVAAAATPHTVAVLAPCTLDCAATVAAETGVYIQESFDATASPSNCTELPAFVWDFGDGADLSHSASASHAYNGPGTYTWTLTVTLGDLTCVKTGGITVCGFDTAPAANPSAGTAPLPVQFRANPTLSSCQGASEFLWNFGDGSASMAQDPSHTFADPGTYIWSLHAVIHLAHGDLIADHGGSIVVSPSVPGDCDGDGAVSIGEVQKAINMFLGTLAPGCGVDCSGDGTVSIGEVQKVINAFLGSASSC
jgi:PKD repeat protein